MLRRVDRAWAECCLIGTLVVTAGWHQAAVADERPIAPGTRLQEEALVAFTEGPAWHATGNVYFSDIANNRILRRDRNGALHVFRSPSGRTNGNLFDAQGRLISCEGGGPEGNRRVTRTELDGTLTVLADSYDGKKFNSPNDLAIDSQGRIYFSDPRYGSRTDIEQFDAEGREVEGVYRIDAPGQVSRIITHEADRPNGLAVSAGDKYLYVADNVNDGPRGLGGNRKLWCFDLRPDGTVDPASRRLVFDWQTDRGPDGMALDQEGRLYVTAGFNFPNPPVETNARYKAGVYVLSHDGQLLQFIPVPADMITNCTFGGEDLRTLYITAGHRLWSIRTTSAGQTNAAPEQAVERPTLNVWPGEVPGEKGQIGAENLRLPEPGAARPVKRYENVSQPTLTLYKPAAELDTGAAVVVCPGGGYNILAWDLEGTEVAEWLNSIGVTAIVLKYRVPRRADLPKHLAPLQDAQRALSIVRSKAAEWKIDPRRIGILGFSAGGHLSAAACTNFDQRQYEPVDAADQASCRPDFAVLVYPAYLNEGDRLSPEIRVTEQTPPIFFAHAGDDRIGPENSIALYLALKQAKVPAELHVYASGGHGFGLRPSEHPCSTWPESCERWLRSQGWLKARE